jgi:hypothetical protein
MTREELRNETVRLAEELARAEHPTVIADLRVAMDKCTQALAQLTEEEKAATPTGIAAVAGSPALAAEAVTVVPTATFAAAREVADWLQDAIDALTLARDYIRLADEHVTQGHDACVSARSRVVEP